MGVVGAGLVSAVLGLTTGMAAGAASAPQVVDGLAGNLRCAQLDDEFGGGQTWSEVRAFAAHDGTFTEPTHRLRVTISNFTGTSFDWSSNIGVDAVYVDAGAARLGTAAHRLYLYDPPGPESRGDTGLTASAPSREIDHVAFCFDVEAAATTTTTEAPTTTTTEAPTVTTEAPPVVTEAPAPSVAPPAEVLATEVTPPPAPAPAPAAVESIRASQPDTLPRTGAGVSRLLWAAGVLLTAGGLAVAAAEDDGGTPAGRRPGTGDGTLST